MGKLRPALPPVVALPRSAPWTAEDRDQFAKFLSSISGARLVERLRAVQAANAIAACAKGDLHLAGKAHGYIECVEHFISLSAASTDSKQTDIGAPGEVPTDETPDQREAREMRELLERLSP